MRYLGAIRASLIVAAVALWVVNRKGWLGVPPRALAAMAGLTVLASVAHLALAMGSLRSRERRVALLASLTFSAGVVAVGAAGLANWLRAVQGFVILTEQETRPLGGGGHLDALDVGPMARSSDLGVVLTLDRVELVPEGATRFRPVANLRVRRPGAEERSVQISPGGSVAIDPLRLHLGAFGFTPRIVIIKDGKAIFDRSVPFSTSQDSGGLRFEGTLELEKEQLGLRGTVTLEGLDERMKGHPQLSLTLVEAGRAIGEGTLAPGHFATLSNGYRLGFAGLKRWAEIDVSRKSYPGPIRVGLVLMAAGALVWPLAAWRRW